MTRRLRPSLTTFRGPHAPAGRRPVASVLAALVALLLITLGVFRISAAGFAANTDNGSGWESGTVTLTDDDAGQALFSTAADGLLDGGQTLTRCVAVTFNGTITTDMAVRLRATAAGTLAPYLNLAVVEGRGGGAGTCTGFTPTASLYTGTLADFAASHAAFGTGVGTWRPASAPETRTFQFTLTVQNVPAAQNATASGTFTWDAKNAPAPPTYSSAVLADGPLANWRLNDTAPAANDAGTAWGYTNAVTPQAPLVADSGKSVAGTGTAPIATSATVPAALRAGNVTLEAWVNIPAQNVHGAFVKIGNGDSGWGVGVGGSDWTNAGHQLILLSETVAWHATGYTLPAGVHHIVAVRDSGAGVTAYVDGVSRWTGTLAAPVAASGRMSIGGTWKTSYAMFLDAAVPLDNVAIYPSALSSARVSAHYAAAGAGYAPAVLADSPDTFLRLDDLTGPSSLVALDRANGHDGTYSQWAAVNQGSLLGDGTGSSIRYSGDSFTHVQAANWMNTDTATVEARVRTNPATLTGQNAVAVRWDGHPSNSIWALWVLDGKAAALLRTADGVQHSLSGNTTLAANQTYTLSMTYDGATLKVFVNGVLDGSTPIAGGVLLRAYGDGSIEFGRIAQATNGDIQVGEVSYYGRALSDDRIAARHALAVTAP